METKIAANTQAAVVCMPKELCRIIAGYAADKLHVWNNVGLTDFGSCTTIDERTTKLTVNEPRRVRSRWHAFVSEKTVIDGASSWTVEYPRLTGETGWIGVGVTNRTENRLSDSSDYQDFCISDKTEWLLADFKDTWTLAYNRLKDDIRPAGGQTGSDVVRISIAADPATGLVTMRSSAWSVDRPLYFPTMNGNDKPTFALLRPCVVLAGPLSAVVRTETPKAADVLPNTVAFLYSSI